MLPVVKRQFNHYGVEIHKLRYTGESVAKYRNRARSIHRDKGTEWPFFVNPDDLTGTWSGTWQWMTCPQRAPVLCVPGAPQSDLSIVISQNFGGGVSGTFFSGGIGAFNGTYLPDAGLTPDIPFGGGLSLVFQLDSTRIDVCQAGVSGTTRGSTLAGTCNASWTAYGNDVASYTIQATKQ